MRDRLQAVEACRVTALATRPLPELVEAGMSDPEIADVLGVTPRTVLRRRQRAGLPSRWTPTPPAHGTLGRYRRGCRCKACKAENTAAAARYRRARAYASWIRRQGRTDAR
jgi:hypothetical protein